MPAEIHVGLSLLTLVPGVGGGVETYARALARALHRSGALTYEVLLPAVAPGAGGGLPARVVTSYRAGRSRARRVVAMAAAAARPRPVRREMGLPRLGVIHFPLNVMLPPVDHPGAVTTVFDVQHELFPRFFSAAERAYRRIVYGWTFRKSRLVITGSRYVARQLVERGRVPAERVRVIPLGIDHERFTPGHAAREPFLLYPANRWPHKNHERLLQAFARVRRRRPALRLVLTGAGHDRGPAAPGVDVRGHVPLEELARLYRTAAALVFPSLYEGFGQPPLEAMACGCPVAASRAASLPEVCGDAAAYFDPTSVDDIAEAVLGVLDAPGELVDRGLERARRFTWDACAREHERVYGELLGEAGAPRSRA
jgi:glycosyltransferase involved in cell wall biosynthesis